MKAAMSAIILGVTVLTVVRTSSAQPSIYRCAGADGVEFTDRRCDAGANPHEVDDSRVSVYTPAPGTPRVTAAKTTKQPKAKLAKPGRGVDPDERQARCAKLHQGLRDVRTKLRTGYGAQEGERLKARQRQLNEQRRAQKCR